MPHLSVSESGWVLLMLVGGCASNCSLGSCEPPTTVPAGSRKYRKERTLALKKWTQSPFYQSSRERG